MTDFFTPERDKLGLRVPSEIREELSNVLLIGDSISCGYTEPVAELLADVCNVRRAPDNCGDTRRGLRDLDAWLGDTAWDLIHFNWGLHDLCYRHPEATVYGHRDKVNGTVSVPLEEYQENLTALVGRLQKRCRSLVWASTTIVPPDEAGRYEGDDVLYNAVAAEVMRAHNIPTNDLYALSATFAPAMFTCPGDVHFSEAGTEALARQVAESIRIHLPDAGR